MCIILMCTLIVIVIRAASPNAHFREENKIEKVLASLHFKFLYASSLYAPSTTYG